MYTQYRIKLKFSENTHYTFYDVSIAINVLYNISDYL